MEKVDKIVIGGGMVFTFLKARGLETGSSLVEEDQLDLAKKLETLAKEKGIDFILPSDVIVALYMYAGFGGDLKDSKSSTGAILCLMGPNTFVPLTWLCKKHTAVSHSSSEAEVIALDAGVRLEGIPALAFWEEV